MNFLAHSVVLPPDAAAVARVGSALPDLWPLLSPRPLPALVLRGLRQSGDARRAELAYGIAHHMQADAIFHSLDDFNRRVDWLVGLVRARWPGLRQSSFYAHVLVEMLLDRWLMEQDPAPLDHYYQAFQPDVVAFVTEHGVSEPGQRDGLRAVLERFATSQFLRTYGTGDGLARRFLGLTRGLPWPWEWQGCDAAELGDGIDQWHAHLGPGSGELVEAVRVLAARAIAPRSPSS